MCIESQHSTPSAETFSKTLGSASDKIDINHSLNLLIKKKKRVGHVIVTVLGNRCLDIKINPQSSFFSQTESPIPVCLHFHQCAHYVYVKVKDAVKKKDSANSVRDRKKEESGEIMQPRLTVMDS